MTLPDMTADVMHSACARLGTSFLADASSAEISYPLEGVLHGIYRRPLVSCVVGHKHRQIAKHVLFVIDSTSPFTYLSDATLEALEYGTMANCMPAVVHGKNMTVYRAPRGKQFADANVMGTDFLRDTQLSVTLDYATLRVEVIANARAV
ncbi:hypothetical protein JKP88DRAFT_241914 [Tribonema minus]|uniref:Uncharacterized protein n=1 Tax=Tribonema minus TaxID=303371 RepID=A0A836CBW8_9STRA|nr:hypothetical protein JKP88DRAFT_241914 [Tribonema minus]